MRCEIHDQIPLHSTPLHSAFCARSLSTSLAHTSGFGSCTFAASCSSLQELEITSDENGDDDGFDFPYILGNYTFQTLSMLTKL